MYFLLNLWIVILHINSKLVIILHSVYYKRITRYIANEKFHVNSHPPFASTFPDMPLAVDGALNIACIFVYNIKKDGLEIVAFR